MVPRVAERRSGSEWLPLLDEARCRCHVCRSGCEHWRRKRRERRGDEQWAVHCRWGSMTTEQRQRVLSLQRSCRTRTRRFNRASARDGRAWASPVQHTTAPLTVTHLGPRRRLLPSTLLLRCHRCPCACHRQLLLLHFHRCNHRHLAVPQRGTASAVRAAMLRLPCPRPPRHQSWQQQQHRCQASMPPPSVRLQPQKRVRWRGCERRGVRAAAAQAMPQRSALQARRRGRRTCEHVGHDERPLAQ